jgi:hypothetical protein
MKGAVTVLSVVIRVTREEAMFENLRAKIAAALGGRQQTYMLAAQRESPPVCK